MEALRRPNRTTRASAARRTLDVLGVRAQLCRQALRVLVLRPLLLHHAEAVECGELLLPWRVLKRL
jgi:hypothetical protein